MQPERVESQSYGKPELAAFLRWREDRLYQPMRLEQRENMVCVQTGVQGAGSCWQLSVVLVEV